jgi:hypothetical protein
MTTRRPDVGRLYAGRFTAFADALLLGALVALGSLPVATWFVALAAAADLARDRESRDVTVGLRSYGERWIQALRTGWAGVVVPTLGLVVVAADLLAVGAGLDQPAFLAPAALAGLLVGALTVRCAAAWRPGRTWRACLDDALRESRDDPAGTALLAGAVLAAALLARSVPPTAVVVPGLLALAGAAVRSRPRAGRVPVP